MPKHVMPDINPNTVVELPEEPPSSSNISDSQKLSWITPVLQWWPIGHTTEAIVAEALGQSLIAGLNEVESLHLAARVFRGRRIGTTLGAMAPLVQAGEQIYAALKQTKQRVSIGFLEAIRVGEDRGQVATELRAFARRRLPRVCQRLIRWTKRSKQAIQFAGALSRLLHDHRLTASVIEDAGRVAAGGDKCFLELIATVVKGMENGDSLAQNLRRFPKHFDPMFIRFIDVPSSRAAFRVNLNMLANDQSI